MSSNHWKDHARQWSYFGSPLRPCSEDIAFALGAVEGWIARTGQTTPTLLIVGVTPELCRLPINEGSRTIAIDNSMDMIRAIWPGRTRARDAAICANWLCMPIADASIDLALADGALSALPYPSGYRDFFRELRRMLRRNGECIIRCFTHPDERETVADVFADLANERIGNFHVLKWRLAMALQPDVETGVAVGSVWSALHAVWSDLNLLANRFGWPIEVVRTIEAYRGIETRYSFPTLAEYDELFSQFGFRIDEILTPAYQLGQRCPTLLIKSMK
jgi:SAM-dependent methyltransferase